MQRLTYTITFLSDAEPGSGVGGELVDDIVPRAADGRPCIRASHLKGLMRAELADLAARFGWRDLAEQVFGAGGAEGDDGLPSIVSVSDALAEDKQVEVRTVTRTAVGDLGVVTGQTLRVTEALPCGSRYRGSIGIAAEPGSALDLAARLALLAVSAIGGGRTRGSGACRIALDGETRSPGQLLHELHQALAGGGLPPRHRPQRAPAKPLSGAQALLQLTFVAESPLCCPEHPEAGQLLRSGPAIPASAVIGALLDRLNDCDPALASACYQALLEGRARCWPLHPCALPERPPTALPVRVALTHRMSKLPDERGEYVFKDEAIAPYDWREVPSHAPLKSADGFLLADGQRVQLWRAGDLPRVLACHAVHLEQRNLYTIESLAPLIFRGWAWLPQEAAAALSARLAQDPLVALGKARSVRGLGRLSAETVEDRVFGELARATEARIFVVQSPLALPDDQELGVAGQVLAAFAERQGWPVDHERCWARLGIRFGWNRLGLGQRASPDHNRLRARRCILPGSVLVLKRPLPELAAALVRGLGDGAEAGFGALLPHPGLAQALYETKPALNRVQSRIDDASRLGLELWQAAGPDGPSPSQIAALLAKALQGAAQPWIEGQRLRPSRVWQRWKPVLSQGGLDKVLASPHAATALRVWHDLAVANRRVPGDRR
ncbi:MAG: hypothetical protein RMM29_08220 [Planctomycetota bacterium]|nr:hypothetical protein [Planctomycetota bacterium]